jgi:glyoxylase-like metal-dependent hydrolase (beta-lactamase superfamily II)
MTAASPDYSIRSLAYAHVDLPAEFFGGVPIHSMEGLKTAAMHYVLLSSRDDDGKEHHYLVDVGYAHEVWIKRFGFYDWLPPDQVLARVGLTPKDIEKIFVSHMHFDHINALSLGLFDHCHLYVQRAEFDGWVGVLALPPVFTPLGETSWITSSLHRDDLEVLARFASRGQLHFLHGKTELLPGITAYPSTGHSFGIQWLDVQTSGGTYVVASDCVFWYSNVEEMWPSAYTSGSHYEMLLTYAEIHQHLGGDVNRIVPGHDMQIFERHPSWKDDKLETAEIHVAGWDRSRRP